MSVRYALYAVRANKNEPDNIVIDMTSPSQPMYGKLTVEKIVSGPYANFDKYFDFIAVIGSQEEHFSLKHGESKIFDQIPLGTEYIVTETPVSGYGTFSQNHQGHITQSEALASFRNTYTDETEKNGSLIITKNVLGTGADTKKEFNFRAVIGEDKYTFKLKHGEGKIFDNIPSGTPYTVTEDDYTAEGYTAAPSEYRGTILEGNVITLFINHHTNQGNTGDLLIKNVIKDNGDNIDNTKLFNFTVVIGEEKQTFALKHNESRLFTNIPSGTVFTVTGQDEEPYESSVKTISGIIASNVASECTFEKRIDVTPQIGKLIVQEQIEGELPESDIEKLFHFLLTVKNQVPVEIELKTGESIEFDLPFGTSYTLREDNYFSDGCALVSVINGSGTIMSGTITSVFTNKFIIPGMDTESSADSATADSAAAENRSKSPKINENILWIWILIMIASLFGLRWILFQKWPGNSKSS